MTLSGGQLPITLYPDDEPFRLSLDAGAPGCNCSRCKKPIEEGTLPIRMWPKDGSYEYRFHPQCLGFQVSDNHDELEDRM